MNYKKMMLVTFVLLAILTLGAVSASEDADLMAVNDGGDDLDIVEAPNDDGGGDLDVAEAPSNDVDTILIEEDSSSVVLGNPDDGEDGLSFGNETIAPMIIIHDDGEYDSSNDAETHVVDLYLPEGSEGDILVTVKDNDWVLNIPISNLDNDNGNYYLVPDSFNLEGGTFEITVSYIENSQTLASNSANVTFIGGGEEEEEEDWIFDCNSDLISFRELVTLSDRFNSGILEITDSSGNVLFRKNITEMERNYDMKGYKYDQFRGYVVFKEDLNNTDTGVYNLTVTYYDDESEIVESVNTFVYLDYTSYVTDEEIDVSDYDSILASVYVFSVMNNGKLEIEIWDGEDTDEDSIIVSDVTVEDWMIGKTVNFTRQDFNLNEGVHTFRVRYVPNNEDPDDHYVQYWKYSYFHENDRVTIVDNTKFRVRMESDSILDENSQFLVYCPEGTAGKTITIEVALGDDSKFFDFDIINDSCYNSFTLDLLNITLPGSYSFNVYNQSTNESLLSEPYEFEIGNPLWIPDVCVLGAVGLERTMVAVLYIDETDNGRLVLTDGDGVELFNETLTDSYYHSLGYDKGYYILYSDFDQALNPGTYNITASYYNDGILRLTHTAEIRIVERNYVEDNETGVGIELLDYYDHNLNDEEDLIALVTVPGYESGYVTVVLTDNENATGWFVFDEIDDDDGLPTFFVSLFDNDVEEGDYLVTVIYLDANDNPVFTSSAWMSFYYRGGDDDGSMDQIDFYIIENDDEERVFEIGDNVHVASLWIPDNEEYGTTVATITVTKNFEPFATFVTSNMEPVYHEDKDADENQIYLDLTQLNDKDIIEFNVDCFDENGRIWTYAIEIDGNNIIFHELNSMIEYYVFYGNITIGDFNNPDLMGPHPNGDFMQLSIPWLYDATNVRFTAKAGETTLINYAFSDSEGEFNYDILGYSYAIPLENVSLMTLLPENEIVTFTLSFGVHSSTFKRIRIGDYVAKVVTPDDVAALYEISVTDDGIFDENEIVVNIAATDDANRQSIYIDIGGGHFSIYVNDVKVENLGEMILHNWIHESGVVNANPEELDEMGINEEVGINPYEFAELNDEEKAAILYDAFAGEFGSELELFRMTSYNFGCPELYLSAADLGIDQSGTYNIKITHIPDVYEPEPGCPEDDYVYYAEAVIVDVDVPVEFDSEETVLYAEDLEMCYKDGSAWTATLTGPDGNPIVNAPVKIGIVGKVYTIKTNSDGVASLPINLGVGVYDVNATYESSEGLKFVSAVVTVKNPAAILSATDLVMIRSDGSAWTVTLTDPNGNPLANAPLKVGIVGKVYTLKTNDTGVARLPISLVVGVYEVNATFEGNARYSEAFITSTITVNYPSVVTLSADDLVMCYKDGSAWNVVLKNASGKPIANTIVKMGILGKVYNIRTDANGVASLPINLGVGVYDVNASFKGTDGIGSAFINATITVKNPAAVLTADDLEMTYQDGSSYSVTLTDPSGNAIKNTVVKITICGKTYDRTTDSNGVATLPINLRAGTYEISARFEGNSRYSDVEITNTIIVNRP